ncbi:hypothetical protein Y694_04516 [Methylibium sp. T29-B]|nr:hypothetical protein Y694_04516 [Methylibium sp. T29-B]
MTRLESDRLALAAAEREVDAAESERLVAVHGVEQARAALAAVRQPTPGRAFTLRAPVQARCCGSRRRARPASPPARH